MRQSKEISQTIIKRNVENCYCFNNFQMPAASKLIPLDSYMQAQTAFNCLKLNVEHYDVQPS